MLMLDQIDSIQGDLKDLKADNYQKLKRRILKHGFISPIHVWQNPETGAYCSIDGVQRLRTLQAMRNEGFDIPPLPVTMIEGKDLNEAKEMILGMVSQFGTLSGQGFLEFISDVESSSDIELPGIDLEKLSDEMTKDHTDKKDKKPKKCPHCEKEI